jgi:hypothetical protein
MNQPYGDFSRRAMNWSVESDVASNQPSGDIVEAPTAWFPGAAPKQSP